MVGITDRTLRNWKKQDAEGCLGDGRHNPQKKASPLAYTAEERALLIERYTAVDVIDMSLPQAYHHLLDNEEYVGSLSTVYRVMKAANLNIRRDGTRARRKSCRPESFCATEPNQVWTWDITYLRDRNAKGRFFYAYVIVDIYSRYVVHSAVYSADNSAFASKFLTEAFVRHGIRKGQLVLHADNGASMKAAETLVVLDRFGVRNSHSRPRVSDDNPYSEAFFKTLKYTGRYPKKGFFEIEDARRWLEEFVEHYNHERRHSGINWVQPAVRHAGVDAEVLKKRAQTLEVARRKHPERWIGKRIMNCEPAGAQHLNPEKIDNA